MLSDALPGPNASSVALRRRPCFARTLCGAHLCTFGCTWLSTVTRTPTTYVVAQRHILIWPMSEHIPRDTEVQTPKRRSYRPK
jgi:hypothetical protein